MTCKVCKFRIITPLREEFPESNMSPGWFRLRQPGVHYCHRYPAVVAKHEDDWCGEFVSLGWRAQEERRKKEEQINETS